MLCTIDSHRFEQFSVTLFAWAIHRFGQFWLSVSYSIFPCLGSEWKTSDGELKTIPLFLSELWTFSSSSSSSLWFFVMKTNFPEDELFLKKTNCSWRGRQTRSLMALWIWRAGYLLSNQHSFPSFPCSSSSQLISRFLHLSTLSHRPLIPDSSKVRALLSLPLLSLSLSCIPVVREIPECPFFLEVFLCNKL